MADDEFIQGAPPKAQDSEFVTGAPPAGVKAVSWQENLKPFHFANGTTGVQRPDGAVYIKEANDPRFKGQEGWKVFDEKTGVWAPATPEDASTYGTWQKRLGGQAWKSFARNLWEGAKRPIEAGGALVADAAHAVGLMNDKTYLDTIQNYEARERYRQAVKNTSGGGFSQFLGEMAPVVAATAVTPAAAPTAFADASAVVPTVTPWLQRAGQNALVGGGTAYVTTPGSQGERAQSGLAAMAVAPAAQVAGDLVPVIGKGLRAVKDRVVMPQPTAPVPTETQAAQELFDRFGIPSRAGDLTGSPTMRRAEDALLRQGDPAMVGVVQAQNQQAQAAAKSFAENLRGEMVKQGFNSVDQIRAAAAAGGKRGAAAQNLLTAMDNAGDDWRLILQTSGNAKLFQGKLAADAAYDAFEKKASQYGEVPLVNTMRAIEEARRELAASGLPDEATQAIVGKLYINLNRQAAQEGSAAAAQAAGGGAATAGIPAASAVDTTYGGLRRLRSSIGNRISDYYTGKNAVVGKEGVGLLERIKGALEQDMEGFAQSNGPELAKAWRDADRIYKTQVAPYKDPALAKALADDSPQKAAQFFLSKGDPYTKTRILNTLDPKGQAAVRAGLLEEAFDAGLNPERGAQAAGFSPAKFAGWLERNKASLDTAFQGSDRMALEGLQKVMRYVDRAGNLGANPENGQVLYGGLHTAHNLTAIGASLKGVSWLEKRNMVRLYTTPQGKALLLQASGLKPDSPAMAGVVDQISRIAAPTLSSAYRFDQPQQ